MYYLQVNFLCKKYANILKELSKRFLSGYHILKNAAVQQCLDSRW